MARRKETLGEQLQREALEYLADLRALGQALKRAEGWFTLALILAVLFMLVVWFITGLGFDRLNDAVSGLGAPRSRVCRTLNDMDAMILVMDAVAMVLLAVVSVGEMMRLLNRMQCGQPKEPRQVAVPAFAMLVVGTAGIVYMRYIC